MSPPGTTRISTNVVAWTQLAKADFNRQANLTIGSIQESNAARDFLHMPLIDER
jgi:hypothetical protein